MPEVRPPGPKGHFLYGSLPELRRDPIAMFVRMREEYGDVVHFRLLNRNAYLFSHPDDVKHILHTHSQNFKKALFFDKIKAFLGNGLLPMTYEDAFWRKRRRLSQPAFSRASMRRYADVMVDATAAFSNSHLQTDGDDGTVVDAYYAMTSLTYELAARTLLSIAPEDGDADRMMDAFTHCLGHLTHKIEAIVDLPEVIPTPRNVRFLRARRTFDDVIYRLIDERRSLGAGAPEDFLTALIRASDAEDGEARASRTQLRDEVLTMFVAGFETTASALAWALWLLARHPEHCEAVRQEVAAVIGERLPRHDDVPKMRYTRMVLDETMRLYPPGWWMTRAPIEDDVIGGYPIRAGSVVVVSQYVTHRHPDFWDEPDRFDPLRFSPERTASRPALAFFPFGDGPRLCIGRNFAYVQMHLVLALAVQRFRMSSVSDDEIPLLPGATLRPKCEVPVKLEPLTECGSSLAI